MCSTRWEKIVLGIWAQVWNEREKLLEWYISENMKRWCAVWKFHGGVFSDQWAFEGCFSWAFKNSDVSLDVLQSKSRAGSLTKLVFKYAQSIVKMSVLPIEKFGAHSVKAVAANLRDGVFLFHLSHVHMLRNRISRLALRHRLDYSHGFQWNHT